MKLIIAGSRRTGAAPIADIIRKAISGSGWTDQIVEIVHGGARGVDSIAHDVCEGLWPIRVFKADWATHGKAAGPIRNRQMAEYADALIAVWDYRSSGTANMINEMKRRRKPVFLATFLPEIGPDIR